MSVRKNGTCDTATCNTENENQPLRETLQFYPKTEAADTTETSLPMYQTIWRYIPEGINGSIEGG